MDIKAKIDEITAKIKSDPALLAKFKEEPVKTIEGIIGMDLPDDALNGLVAGVKAKLGGGDLLGAVKKLF